MTNHYSRKLMPFFVFLLLIFGLLIPEQVHGQNYVDLLKMEFGYSGNNRFEQSNESSNVVEGVVDVLIPLVLNEKNTVLTGFLYETVRVTTDPSGKGRNLYMINPKLGMNRVYSERWSATYLLLPKLSSDLISVGRKDFQLGGVSIFKLTKSPTLNYKFGLYYNSELFGSFLVPMVGIYSKKNRLETNILLPLNADINYTLVGTLRVGFKFSGFKKTFHLTPDGASTSQYLAKANNEVLGYLAIGNGRVHLMGMAGHSIGRSYRTYDTGDQIGLGLSAANFGDHRTQLNTDFKDGYVFKAAMVYRYAK